MSGWWKLIGYAGNIIFGSRFFVQWIASERAGRVVVPRSFWHMSIVGSMLTLAYAIVITSRIGWGDGLPLILGAAPNAFIYFRNLTLMARHEKTLAARETEDELADVTAGG